VAIVISDADARRLISMAECIDAMRVAFRDLSDGRAANMPRMRYAVETADADRRYLANIQAGAVPSFGMAAVRAGSRFVRFEGEGEARRVLHNPDARNWTVIILYDLATAEPVAFLHETHISGIRVGATVGVAVDAAARADSGVLGLFGTGRQAGPICEAVCAVRPIRRVQVYSPTPGHRAAFCERMTRHGVECAPVSDPRAVVRGADVVCCATSAATPVFDGAWLEPGQTVVTIVNSDVTGRRSEADETTFRRAADIIINDWDSVHANRQVELTEPIDSGAVNRERVHTLGDVLTGRAEVRRGPDDIVYYKNNTGLGMQFAAAGAVIYRKLVSEGGLRVVPPEWLASEPSKD
jgi:ornithine cyclodeaminase/alanine dehydrogenase-like protein (mu-crystallin family)